MTARRIIRLATAIIASLVIIATISTIFVLRSGWFYEKVRDRIVTTVETATGGRTEAGSFRFDWHNLRAEVGNFTLHGTEPAGKPPLFHASRIAVGLKIISLWKRDVDIQYLDVTEPHVYLIVGADGRTNIPEPKIKTAGGNTLEDILKLAIDRFDLNSGIFEIETGGRTPFDAHGRNLAAALHYDRSGPRYLGELSIQPLDVRTPDLEPLAVALRTQVALEKNRISVTNAHLTTGDSSIDLTGSFDDLNSPRAAFDYRAHVSIPDLSHTVRAPELQRGVIDIAGRGAWSVASGPAATGEWHAYGIEYRDSTLRLRDGRAEGRVSASGDTIEATGLRLSAAYLNGANRVPVDGRIASAVLRGRNLDFHGAEIFALGGTFHGTALVRNFDRYKVEGELAGFDIRRTVAVYSPQRLPWDGRASGTMLLESSLENEFELRASANLNIAPAPDNAPVHGQITASYEARGRVLDVGQSTLILPSSRVDFSGVLPPGPGRQMEVRLVTRDLEDLLPAIGERAADLPVKLAGGAGFVLFDGTVAGTIDEPLINGRLSVVGFAYEGRAFDSLQGTVAASPANVRLSDATLVQGSLRAQFQAAVALHDWKADDASLIAGTANLRDADVADLLHAAQVKDVSATGALVATAQINGAVGNPVASADIEMTKGAIEQEPFDRLTARVNYNNRTLEIASVQVAAGPGRMQASATFDHLPGRFDAGRLRFRIQTNPTPLEQIHTIQETRPGVKGTAQVTANGDLDFATGRGGGFQLKVADFHADVLGQKLQLTGQSLGDAHLTANSQGQVLRAHLESDFANSAIRGDGEWRLEGDIPGTATVTFPKLDFAQLRAWLSPESSASPAHFTGSAEGELQVDGPMLKPGTIKAQLRLAKVELGPPADSKVPASAGKLTNSDPIVASFANSVITVDRAHLVGRGTDLNISGKVVLKPRDSLDVRIDGRTDLSILQDVIKDLSASGQAKIEASVRGTLESPQPSGRVEFQNAAFNLADFPNGLSNANAVIALAGDRATIQSFTGSSGGGKVDLTGFIAYGSSPEVFRLHADAHQVRVRYPEGVSTVADAALDLNGTSDRSTLSGTITVLRTGINLQSDLGSVIAASAEPVRTPSVQSGLLGGLNFDVQIVTSPDIQFQSSLTQDLQVEANLQLRGTVTNPAVLGRISVTQGQVIFYGSKYNVNQGSISFFNPARLEPILDVDLETRERGIDVTLTVAGPLNKLTLTPRSDPPLQFSEIVALLATGRTPTSDPTLLARESSSPAPWQQTGASALLGQAIANPVAGRLQRFFGVSKLRIDPTLPGVENNPQARITLEQQVTPDITFTYITNTSAVNQQAARIEWTVSKQWSLVALREETGAFGLDFFFKKQF